MVPFLKPGQLSLWAWGAGAGQSEYAAALMGCAGWAVPSWVKVSLGIKPLSSCYISGLWAATWGILPLFSKSSSFSLPHLLHSEGLLVPLAFLFPQSSPECCSLMVLSWGGVLGHGFLDIRCDFPTPLSSSPLLKLPSSGTISFPALLTNGREL